MDALRILGLVVLLAPCALSGCKSRQQTPVAVVPVDHTLVLTGKNPEAVALVRQGLDLVDNARRPDAVVLAKKALALEPDLACALALEALGTPGDDGDALIAKANSLAASLPEAERAWISFADADHRGDFAAGLVRAQRLVELLPNAPRAWFLRGAMFDELSRYPEATAALQKAIALDPTYAAPLNRLAYVALAQGDTAAAVSYLERYAQLRPDDPNPNDSLGEVLLGAGRIEEAQKAFERASKIDPGFPWAWEGIAFARLLLGDERAGLAAFDKCIATAPPEQKPDIMERDLVLVQIALGRTADAQAQLKQLEADAKKVGADSAVASVPLYRALAQIEAGDATGAVRTLDDARATVERSEMPAVQRATVLALHARISAWEARHLEAKLGAKPAAELAAKAAATAATAAGGRTGVPALASALAFATAERAALAHRFDEAAARFASCDAQDDLCALELADALEGQGDAARARSVREKLVASPKRDGWSFFARTKAKRALDGK